MAVGWDGPNGTGWGCREGVSHAAPFPAARCPPTQHSGPPASFSAFAIGMGPGRVPPVSAAVSGVIPAGCREVADSEPAPGSQPASQPDPAALPSGTCWGPGDRPHPWDNSSAAGSISGRLEMEAMQSSSTACPVVPSVHREGWTKRGDTSCPQGYLLSPSRPRDVPKEPIFPAKLKF